MNLASVLDTSFPKSKHGFYFEKNREALSYPKEGYNFCFDIEDESYWFQHRNEIIKNYVKRYCSNGTFADIGGGNGVVTKALESVKNIDPVLIEPGEQGCVNATKREVEFVVQATVEQLAEKKIIFDYAGMFDVIEHIEKPVSFLKSAKKVLKPKAKVLVTVPAYQKLWSAEDVEAGHFRRYNLKMAKSQLSEAGYKLIDHSYFFFALPVPIFLARALKKKGVAKKEDYILPNNIAGNILKKNIIDREKQIKKEK